MTKTNFIATDTILVGAELKAPGDTFEVSGDVAAAKMKKQGHLVEGSEEAAAYLAKKKNKKNFHSKMTPEAKPAKTSFNDDEDDVETKGKAKAKGGKGKKSAKDDEDLA